jgi:hypothetical protein
LKELSFEAKKFTLPVYCQAHVDDCFLSLVHNFYYCQQFLFGNVILSLFELLFLKIEKHLGSVSDWIIKFIFDAASGSRIINKLLIFQFFADSHPGWAILYVLLNQYFLLFFGPRILYDKKLCLE